MEVPAHVLQIAQGRLKVATVVIATITIEAMITKVHLDKVTNQEQGSKAARHAKKIVFYK